MNEQARSVELRLRAAVESSPSGLLMSDSSGLIVLVNREIERLFGYSREELLGKPVDILVPERLRRRHPDFRSGFMATPSTRAMGAGRDLFGVRKDGVEIPVEIGLTPVATTEGLFVLSSIVDISARRRAEARFRAAVESSPNGMVMVDGNGQIILVNKEVERMFGYDRAELLGRSIEMLVPERFRAHHPVFRTDFYHQPQARAMGVGRDLYGLRKDGSELPVEIGLNPIETDDGVMVLSSIVDISARRQAEDQRRRSEEDLRQSQKLEALGTLAGGVAHDFNNILATIVSYAELAGQAPDTASAKADLELLMQSALRGKQLVERILLFSRRQEQIRVPTALQGLVNETVKLLRATLPPSVEIRAVVGADAPRVLADATSVQQVLMNLSTNAAHAMPGGGTLSVVLEPFYVRDSMARARPDLKEGAHALLIVKDTGVGMDSGVLDHAFEPFFTTKPPGSGTGLGLSIVHSIMKGHGGTVDIFSEQGRGTSVWCYFPAMTAAAEDAAVPSSEVPRGRGEHVLLVEDEPMLAEAGQRRIISMGYRCSIAHTGEDALARFSEQPGDYDVVVTDYLMPKMVGIDLARAISALRPGMPIIMMTGYVEDLPSQSVREAGVHLVLNKPVLARELALGIDAVLRKRAAAGAS